MRQSPDSREQRLEDVASGALGRLVRTAGIAVLFVLVAAGLVVMGFWVGRWAVGSFVPGPQPSLGEGGQSAAPPPRTAPQTATAVLATAGADVAPGDIEVPEVRGMRVDEALVLLQTSGFTVVVTAEETSPAAAPQRLVSLQSPQAGTIAAAESTVTLTAPPPAGAPASKNTTAPLSSATFVVCIDPGHQTHSDQKLESVGPGAKKQTPRSTGGATGVATGLPEYEIALELSVRLKKRLEAQGVRIVMTRTANDVQLSNAERAQIANKAHADLFIRIHCGASTIATESGCRTLFPAKNRWTAAIVSESKAAATAIQTAAVRASGARDGGARPRGNVVGFNWSKVPSVMIETGYLSNPIEDRLLASPTYQDRLATGLAEGVLNYLRRRVAG